MDIGQELETLSRWIAEGRGNEARQRAEVLVGKRVPDRHRAELARLCWRLGQPVWGIRLLRSRVRPRTQPSRATVAQVAEYSACLIKAGLVREGLRLLEPLNANLYPNILLYRVFGLVTQWRYGETIALLSEYCEHPATAPYSRLVGKVNLLSAYNYADRPAEFGELLGELTEQLSRKSHYLLLGNCYELAVSRAVRERKWKQAKSTLNRSRQALEKVESYDRLLLEKWESLLAWHEGKTSALQEFRKKALRARHWESLRETDLWEGLFRKNRALQDKVYFGTPYPAYRERLTRLIPGWNPPESYDLVLGGSKQVLDLRYPLEGLPPLMLDLFRVLSGDFYRPFSAPRLHQHLHPDQFFHPDSSAHRIHELIRRSRQWLRQNQPTLTIEESGGVYCWGSQSSITLKLASEPKDQDDENFENLRRHGEGRSFSLKQAARAMGVPERTLSRWLQEWERQGRVERTGRGKATRYRIFDQVLDKSA